MNAGPDMVDSEVRCEIELTRVPMYYLCNIVLVVFVLVLVSFCVVGVPFEDLADRMSITMTLMLTVVAFKFVIAGMVPPTPYLTFMDKYVLSAFVSISMHDRGGELPCVLRRESRQRSYFGLWILLRAGRAVVVISPLYDCWHPLQLVLYLLGQGPGARRRICGTQHDRQRLQGRHYRR